jgi:hypothetical protein
MLRERFQKREIVIPKIQSSGGSLVRYWVVGVEACYRGLVSTHCGALWKILAIHERRERRPKVEYGSNIEDT